MRSTGRSIGGKIGRPTPLNITDSFLGRNPMKERTPIITIENREDTKIDWDPETKSFILLDSNGNVSEKHLVSLSEGYAREGKTHKILRQVKNHSGSLISLPPTLNVYDKYFSIDTSYKELGDNFLCATGCVIIDNLIDKSGQLKNGETINISVPPRLIFLAAKGSKPERYGWMKFMQAFQDSRFYDERLSFGVVVDSDLDELRKIENNEIVLAPSFTLPSNFNLIYASADGGKENMLNVLIAAADKVASNALTSALEAADKYSTLQLEKEYFDIEVKTDEISNPLGHYFKDM